MKKLLISYILILIFGLGCAQKMAYVDTQYILKQIPQFQNSEQRLNSEVKKWQDHIVNQQSQIEKLKISFENEKILLTEDQQKNRLATIDSTEKLLNEFIDKKFGSNGESVTLRYNLAKPLQDQIWNAINTIAAKDKYNIVFDKSSDLIMIFTDSKYDITDKVLKQLGINDKNKDKKEKTASKNSEVNNSNNYNDKIEEESIDNNPKTGYGSKYTPKKKTKKPEVKEENKNPETPDSEDQPTESSKPKTGYGSKYTPKKKTEKPEVKEENKNSEATDSEIQPTEPSKPKTGYGSKYTPKKKTEKPEVKEENKNLETDKEIKSTETPKPKTGYGSKYTPKK
ncbi:OmpH family outer membrane protein [Apibacter adventoris]|uniref:Molecular chaperone Skp n=1 Tax=Apibacter adventoris TaxID=1679466 RepID=A0A2S8AGP8_9FLAO|nr:OmpH family outer membrane protein [Apibacter adventoris]PQL95453.1 hypothetical protein C4S77_01260 [Apibacter adventoris]